MENQEGGVTNGAPMFNGTNYVFWKVGMKSYIQSLGAYACDGVEEEYQKALAVLLEIRRLSSHAMLKP